MRSATMNAYFKRRHELWAAIGQLELAIKEHERNVIKVRRRASTQDVADLKHVGGMVRGLETYLKTFDGGRQ